MPALLPLLRSFQLLVREQGGLLLHLQILLHEVRLLPTDSLQPSLEHPLLEQVVRRHAADVRA